MEKSIVILGSCGGSRDVWWAIRDTYPETKVIFLDDSGKDAAEPFLKIGDEQVPVLRDWDFSQVRQTMCKGQSDAFTHFLCGMGEPVVKRLMVEKALEHGLKPAPSIAARQAFVQPDCDLGYGGAVHPSSFLASRVHLGDYVTLTGARCGHDCSFGDFSTGICPDVGGHACVESGVFLGLGSIVGHRVRIAPWVRVGVQSAVIKDITEPGIIVIGVPAKKRRAAEYPPGWLE
jgi:serine acetyltransferase